MKISKLRIVLSYKSADPYIVSSYIIRCTVEIDNEKIYFLSWFRVTYFNEFKIGRDKYEIRDITDHIDSRRRVEMKPLDIKEKTFFKICDYLECEYNDSLLELYRKFFPYVCARCGKELDEIPF